MQKKIEEVSFPTPPSPLHLFEKSYFDFSCEGNLQEAQFCFSLRSHEDYRQDP